MWEVIVGNVGTVYQGPDADKAMEFFRDYKGISEKVEGSRAYGEDVTLFLDGEIASEHKGHIQWEEVP